MGNKLYVGNLSYNIRDDELHQAFAQYGSVTSAKVMMDRETGRSKGFGFVEMGSDPEAQAATAQHVHLRRLLGDERGLALGQDQNAGDELKPRGHAGQEAEEHHRLVEWMLVRVRPRQLGLAARVRAEHVVVDEQVVVAEPFGRLRVVLDGLDVVAELDLGEHDSVLHGEASWRRSTVVELLVNPRLAAAWTVPAGRGLGDILSPERMLSWGAEEGVIGNGGRRRDP